MWCRPEDSPAKGAAAMKYLFRFRGFGKQSGNQVASGIEQAEDLRNACVVNRQRESERGAASMKGSNDSRFLKLESFAAVRLTTGSTRTRYSALFQCAGIFTFPKRTVTGRLSQR